MEDRKLEAAESLALIGRMIENTRSRMVRNSGRPLLAWGYATVLTTLAVWLLILRHIELEQCLLAAEPADRQCPRQCGLAHAGRPQKQHSTDGTPRLSQTGAAAPDGSSHGRHRSLLTDDLGIQAAFQLVQTLPLLLAHPLGGHAAGGYYIANI